MTEREDPAQGTGAVPARQYDDEDVRRILKAAADLQERALDRSGGAGGGLTLAELRSIAAEAGIDPKYVEMAAAQTSAGASRTAHALVGAPFAWDYRMSLPGEIEDEHREQILHLLRKAMGSRGEIDHVFGRLEITFDDGAGPVIVGVSSREDRTDVSISVARASEAGLLYGLGVPFGGLLLGALTKAALGLSGPAVLLAMAGGAVVSWGLVRVGWMARSRWWERKSREIADTLSRFIQEVARVDPGQVGEGEGAPALPPPPRTREAGTSG